MVGHHSSPVTWHKYCIDYWICHTVKYGEEHACKTREEKVKLSNEVHNFITLIITINRKMVSVDKCYFFYFLKQFWWTHVLLRATDTPVLDFW